MGLDIALWRRHADKRKGHLFEERSNWVERNIETEELKVYRFGWVSCCCLSSCLECASRYLKNMNNTTWSELGQNYQQE